MFVHISLEVMNLSSVQLHNVVHKSGVCSHTHSMEFMSTELMHGYILHATVFVGINMYSGIF